jgi:hypothetical protein
VSIRVRNDMRPLITEHSVPTLGSVSLLGEPAVDIHAIEHGTAAQAADRRARRRRGHRRSAAAGSDDYDNMNGAITELRKLVFDIRADPRRYLNVRVSLF